MAIMCAWAAWDEHHNARGGKAGDQTGGEVHTGKWWNFGQNVILRANDEGLADRIATVMQILADGQWVGYDQANRTSLYEEMARIHWKPENLAKKVETDCSAMVATAITAAGVTVSKNLWTGNMKRALQNTGKFTALGGDRYTQTDVNLKRGDIILNEATHVIVALENGANETYHESGFSKLNMNYPSAIIKGTPFTIHGTIKSGAKLAGIEVGVYDKSKKKWMPQAHVKKAVNGFSFDLSKVDASIHFAQLEPGSYVYKVKATDVNGISKALLEKAFTVVANAPKKTLKAIAREIYAGECSDARWKTWGNGTTRKSRLKQAGYNAEQIAQIQKYVDALF